MQTIMGLFSTKVSIKTEIILKNGKPKLNETVERILFYSMTSFLVIYLYSQFI